MAEDQRRTGPLIGGLPSAPVQVMARALSGLATRLGETSHAFRKRGRAQAERRRAGLPLDVLTDLPGRTAFLDLAGRALRAGRPDEGDADGLGVIVVKIDGLEYVNRQYGRPCGDTVLKYLADAFSSYALALHSDNRVARTGKAEFSFLVHGATDEIELKCLAHVLIALVCMPIKTPDINIRLTGEPGVSLRTLPGMCTQALTLKAAPESCNLEKPLDGCRKPFVPYLATSDFGNAVSA